ncbi:hypothetical protein GQX74_013331 [Glossina fuscipes]|nr:hypothetical protein GQX74_013331 [Glossina fuscipes]
MLVCLVLLLSTLSTDCLASSLKQPTSTKSSPHVGDITEIRKISTSSFMSPSLSSSMPSAPPSSISSFPASVSGNGGGASASSRFNVDLRRSGVSASGAIHSPTTFIHGSPHQVHRTHSRRPSLLSSASSAAAATASSTLLSATTSMSSVKQVFEEKTLCATHGKEDFQIKTETMNPLDMRKLGAASKSRRPIISSNRDAKLMHRSETVLCGRLHLCVLIAAAIAEKAQLFAPFIGTYSLELSGKLYVCAVHTNRDDLFKG